MERFLSFHETDLLSYHYLANEARVRTITEFNARGQLLRTWAPRQYALEKSVRIKSCLFIHDCFLKARAQLFQVS